MKTKNYLAKNSKKLMKERNLTLDKVSKDLGIPIPTLQGWLDETIIPDMYEAYYLAEYLGVSIDFLLNTCLQCE